MGIRRNIATNSDARDDYVQGVLLLKSELHSVTTADLGIPSRPGVGSQQLSTWDLFVYWHMQAMFDRRNGRNAAHNGPVFLPWHRWMMILLEQQFQRVLNDPDFGIPYWDWAADGDLPSADQTNQPVWDNSTMGGNGRLSDAEVTDGPFSRSTSFRVRIENGLGSQVFATDRPLRRRIAAGVQTLPTRSDVNNSLGFSSYDAAPWNSGSTSMRNFLEGWRPNPPSTHNRVHVWIGGDMGAASSPNDPAFYLNHCNVDRYWAIWQSNNPSSDYLPAQSESEMLRPHRREDPLNSILTSTAPLVSDMLDVSSRYTYDSLVV